MKNLKIFLLFLMSITSCNSSRTASQYFDRLKIESCITAFEVGYMFCDGEKLPIPPKMQIPKTVQDSDYMIEYYEDKEYRLYICLRFGECN